MWCRSTKQRRAALWRNVRPSRFKSWWVCESYSFPPLPERATMADVLRAAYSATITVTHGVGGKKAK